MAVFERPVEAHVEPLSKRITNALATPAEPVTRREPLVLNQPLAGVYVVEGTIDVFWSRGAGHALTPVAHVTPGQLLLGCTAVAPQGELQGLAGPSTRIVRVAFPELRARLLSEIGAHDLASLIEEWLLRLAGDEGTAAAADRTRDNAPQGVSDGDEIEHLALVTWLELLSGTVELQPPALNAMKPEIAVLWPSRRAIAHGDAQLRRTRTEDLLNRPEFAALLDAALSDAVVALQLRIDARREAEHQRLERKEELLHRQLEGTLAQVAAALEDRGQVEPVAADADALLAAVREIGRRVGFSAARPPASRGRAPDPLEDIAQASRVRKRPVALQPGWEHETQIPLLGFLNDHDGRHPVVLVSDRRRRKQVLDPQSGQEQPLDAAVADRLHPIAYQFYRPLPVGQPMTGRRLLRFALSGGRHDLTRVVTAAIAVGLLGLLTPILTRTIFDHIIPSGQARELYLVGAALVLAAGAAMAFSIVQGIAVVRLANRLDLNAQSALWDRLISLPVPFFRGYTAGDLANRALGLDRIRQILASTVMSSALALVASLFNLALMYIYSPGLAAVATGLLLLATIGMVTAALLQVRYVRDLTILDNRIQGELVQAISGVAKVRIAGAESRIFARLMAKSLARQRLAFRQQGVAVNLSAFNSGLSAIVFAVLFVVIVDTSWGHVDVPTFLAFNAAFGVIVGSLIQLSNQIVIVAPAIPLYTQLTPILDAAPEIDRAEEHPGRLTGQIEVSNVSFRYGADGPLVLDDVSLSARPGEFVAVVGSSGSGKSTLLRLLLGFEQPELGHVLYDDKNLAKLDVRAVRRQIGVVLQSSRLVPGTIYSNIVGSADLTLDDAWEAARLAGIEDDIRNMPMGMQTMVAELGGTVSGGQAQRILIARALATRPRLIFFDEATSALDNERQRIVTDSLAEMKATRIVIAHRLSTVRDADHVLVLEHGRVVETGGFDELLQAGGALTRIAERQLA